MVVAVTVAVAVAVIVVAAGAEFVRSPLRREEQKATTNVDGGVTAMQEAFDRVAEEMEMEVGKEDSK